MSKLLISGFHDVNASVWLAVLAAVAMVLPVLVPSSLANRLGPVFAKWIARLGVVVLALAVLAVGGSAWQRISGVAPVSFHGMGFSFQLDALSSVMLLLVAFLGAVVTRYSCTYLAGDHRQGFFAKWMAVTIGAVLMLVIAGNLLMFTLAWVATSMSLHQLLTFYPDRPAALLAARKKFLISRLGDAALMVALVLTWQCFGTWQFDKIFAAVEVLESSGSPIPVGLSWAVGFLVAGALLKSAQFPFHSWLPDTMETPTPVSALMHAGIINAGGFLVVRLSPMLTAAPAALNALALVGAFTALFASVVMLTQTSVKRTLAYSTIAQMGFMMLQCGLGAFSLAVLHIVAHSLYKAHAFLSSGNIVHMTRTAWVPSDRPASHPVILIGTLAVSLLLTVGVGWIFGITLADDPAVLLLGCIFMMALAYMLWNLWASSHRSMLIGWGMLIGAASATAYFGLHWMSKVLLAPSLPDYDPVRSSMEHGVLAVIGLLFMAVLVFQSQLPSWSSTRLGRKWYAHAARGFYLGTLGNLITSAFTTKSTSTVKA